MTNQSRLIACIVMLASILACSLPAAVVTPPPAPISLVTVGPDATSTPTPFQPSAVTDLPLPTDTLVPTSTPTDLPTPTYTPPPPAVTETTTSNGPTSPPPASDRTQYILNVNLDYANRSLAADQTIRYVNKTGQPLTEIILAVPPNLREGAFVLNSLNQDGNALTNYSINGERMSITLPQTLEAGATTTFTLNFTLYIPPKRYEGTFGYLGYQINLTDWYPFIVPFSGGWVLHDQWAFGEHLVYDSSDIEVNLKVSDPAVIIAASAPAETNGEWTRYRIYGARTFAFSASDRYLVSESAVGTVLIRTYYFSGFEGAGEGLLRAAVSAVGLFDAKFGPYPYDSLSVVETDVPDGQEYDGLVFLGTKFYAEYGGSARSNLVSIGVHEISHQWWFGLVGNDQAMEPWLDEALATYSENTFYYYTNPRLVDWWWGFRVNYFSPGGWVDSSVYEQGTFRSYVNAVYLNGANFLYDLNVRMGDDDFYSFLRDYASRYSRSRASSTDFFNVLRQDSRSDVSDLIQAYFQGSY